MCPRDHQSHLHPAPGGEATLSHSCTHEGTQLAGLLDAEVVDEELEVPPLEPGGVANAAEVPVA
eukprot:11047580-Alexandrium_andersonii.AAC.1